MVEHELSIFSQLMARALARIPRDAELDEAQAERIVRQLADEDPEARELIDRLNLLRPPRHDQQEGA
jgi:hypothetical protein